MKNIITRHPIIPFTLRFIVLHVLTYLVFGILFMLGSRYFEYFKSDPMLSQVMKPSDSLSVQFAPFVQIVFGSLFCNSVVSLGFFCFLIGFSLASIVVLSILRLSTTWESNRN